MWSSRYMEEPLFLKASECIDIHATGALSQFAVLKMSSAPKSSQKVDEKSSIFNIDENKFVPLDTVLYNALYAYVKCEKTSPSDADDAEKTSLENKLQVNPYIMTASEYNEHCREVVKKLEDHFVILSMVCCPDNIEKLTSNIREDKREMRAVKMMKRQYVHKRLTFTSFMRIKCTGSYIDGEVSLLQVEDGDGNFILVTCSDAMLGERGQIYKQKSVTFEKAHDAFQKGLHISDIALAAGFPPPGNREAQEEQLPVTTGPVVVLQNGKSPVELMTRLSDETRAKICESKNFNPTQIHAATCLTGLQGSAFKYAATVSLGFLERPGRVMNLIEGHKIKTLLLESKH